MTLIEFVALLRTLGYPVAHSHFRVDGDNPAPPLPFITYRTPSSDHMMADNRVYFRLTDVNVELYTRDKDLEAEQKVEDLLDEHEVPYNTTQVWIDSEQVFQTLYELRLI